jgi:S-adenosylmethionine synthetase
MTTAFGHACSHSPERLAYPIWAAHRVVRSLDAARRDGRMAWLHPDGQAQVAVRFVARRPARVEAIAITSASFGTAPPDAAAALFREVVSPAFEGALVMPDAATRFVYAAAPGAGGPETHSGLTGRKTAEDTYGGYARQGSSGLSGKSPARIDRIASYAARHAARCIVEAGLAEECEVQLCYLIGDTEPISVEVDCFGTSPAGDAAVSARLASVADFRVPAIAERFGLWELPLRRGGRFYRNLAVYGHMGRADLACPWEDVSLANALA